MKSVEVEVRNPSGLHARPAADFVKMAATFKSKITVENRDRGRGAVNAKSILSFMGQGFLKGSRVVITADGPDEGDAVEALRTFVDAGAGERLEA